MAAFDWMSQDIGGYNNAVNDPGGLGVSQGTGATGITWQQLLSAASRDPGMQTGSSLPFGPPQQQYAPPKNNVNLYQLPQVKMPRSQQQGGDDWGSIMQILANVFASGSGTT